MLAPMGREEEEEGGNNILGDSYRLLEDMYLMLSFWDFHSGWIYIHILYMCASLETIKS